ncbi:MAG TPA: hypothetical protein VN081_00025 [Dongiaceae bacterium]|nr:hypothetical protein [Dongiaceae bacterium]
MEVRSVSRVLANSLEEAISSGSYRFAYELGQRAASANPALDAHFWFQYALAAQLIGEDGTAMVDKARKATGYSDLMECDFQRDTALLAIRKHRLKDASNNMKASRKLIPFHDGNRQAAARMVDARIHYALGRYKTAAALHADANRQWINLGDNANQQWMRNNRFHWWLAAVRARNSDAYNLGGDILRDEPIERRRQLVRWETNWGRTIVVAYSIMERLRWQLTHLITRPVRR